MSFGLLQHWMKLLAPQKLPIEYIVNYAKWKDSCVDLNKAVDILTKYICPSPQPEEETVKEKTKARKKP